MSIFEYENLKSSDSWCYFASSSRNFFQAKESLYFINDAYVSGEDALILDANLDLIDYLLHEVYYWVPNCFDKAYGNIYSNPESMRIAIAERRTHLLDQKNKIFTNNENCQIILDEAIYLLHPFGWYAYGHLNDTLLRIKSLQSMSSLKVIPFLVSDFSRIVDFKVHLRAILGFDPKIVELKKGQNARIKKLAIPFSNSVYTSFIREDYIWMREKYLDYFKIREMRSEPLRLYLSRNHVIEGERSVLNEKEIQDFLTAQGFITLRGDEPLEEIVKNFYYAELVVGYHGSLFANLIFSKEKCRVLEFCAKNREDHSFEVKYKLVNDYHYELVDADEKYNANLSLESVKNFVLKGVLSG